MNRRQESLRPLVDAVRSLLETAGPEAQAFLRDWPRELIARPTEARSLPVVSALEGLSRYAAPRTRALVEAIAALAGELDWRQTYSSADFGERFSRTTALANGSVSAAPSQATRSPAAFSSSARRPNIPPIRTRRKSFISLWPGMPHGVGQIRLAASPARDMDSSSLLDDPRHANGRRALARGLRLARGRPHGEISHRRLSPPKADAWGKTIDASSTR